MTDPNSYIPEDSPNLEFVYNNESTLQPIYWPVFYSELVNKQDARELYNDDNTQYITYSGSDWKSLMVSRQKDGRYRNFTIKSFSGESFDFYLEVGSLYDINQSFYAGPVTTSGSYNTLVYYSGEASAQSNLITFTAPTDNTSVFVLPEVSTASYIKLHHKAVSSGETYRLYQFLPRTLIQVDDLEADAIDAVTIRVSDSIVVTADKLEDNSILGRKIRNGTVSGTLITPGTITTNLIAVSGIDADRINVSVLSALTTNTGSLNVTDTITISSGEIDAGVTKINQNGITIGNYTSLLPATDALKVLGSGSTGDIVGLAMYNAAFSTTTPQFSINLDGTNTVEIRNNKADNSFINISFPEDSVSSAVKIFDGNIDLIKGELFFYNDYNTTRSALIDRNGNADFSGNVGIGTQSPSYKLHVVGDTFSTNLYASTADTQSTPSHSWASDPDTGIYHAALGIIGFSTNGAEAARINSNNVLSVNTTNQNGQITVEVPDGTARYTLTLRQLNDSSPFINFAGSSSAGTTTPVNTAAVGTYRGKVRVGINGVVRWIPFYD